MRRWYVIITQLRCFILQISRSEVFQEMTLELPVCKLQPILDTEATHINTIHDQVDSWQISYL